MYLYTSEYHFPCKIDSSYPTCDRNDQKWLETTESDQETTRLFMNFQEVLK